MPRNGSGTYTLPSGNPVVTGTTISSTWANTTLSDIGTGLTNSIAKDGQTTPTANLPMGGFKHSNVGAGTATTDYARIDQIQNSSAVWLSSVSGTDTITASATPSPSAYAAGQSFRFVTAGSNTDAATINISGLGAKSLTKNGATALAAGELPSGAVVEIVYDGTQFQVISLLKIGTSANNLLQLTSAGILPAVDGSQLTNIPTGEAIFDVDASASGNAMTLTINPQTIKFRSTTLTDGTPVTRTVSSPISTIISSGSTGGTTNGVQSTILIAAIDNAGTVEVAWCNMAGGLDTSESTLISTTAEGGAGGADSATTWYSTTARSNVAYRIVGSMTSTQATAGTWATQPSLVQGKGGLALANLASFGVGQRRVSRTGSYSFSTNYWNTTGKPIGVSVITTQPGGASLALFININGASIYAGDQTPNNGGFFNAVQGMVLPGEYYSVTSTSSATVYSWSEITIS